MKLTIFPRRAAVESILIALEDQDIETLKKLGQIEYRPDAAPTVILSYARSEVCVACSTKSRLAVCSCAEPCGEWDECIAAQAEAAYQKMTAGQQ